MLRLMPIDKEKQRARWLRNKRAQRERAKQDVRVPSPKLLRMVRAERNRRVKFGLQGSPAWREGHYFDKAALKKAVTFAADVWEATVLIDYELGEGKATPTRIARHLADWGKDQGYSDQSLRKMVYVARDRIAYMESCADPANPSRTVWEPFNIDDWSSCLV